MAKIPIRGFESYNTFRNSIKDIKQLYDLTYHLYILEHERLKDELPKAKNKLVTIKTTVGEISHSLTAMYQKLGNSYPYKLRQFLLVSSITSLEVYLTDVVYEIFKRDIAPFKEDMPLTFQKNYLLNLGSVNELQKKILLKDVRNLTSGGLQIIEKYFKKIFSIEFRNLGIPFEEIEEIHIRRHLFVHRDGYADNDYCQKFPQHGLTEGDKVKLEHDYFIVALNKLTEFAGLVNKRLISMFPSEIRNPKYEFGTASYNFDNKNVMVEISIIEDKFNHLAYFQGLEVRGKRMKDFVIQITTIEKTCFVFMSGEQRDLFSFFRPIKENPSLAINRVIELKNNASVESNVEIPKGTDIDLETRS